MDFISNINSAKEFKKERVRKIDNSDFNSVMSKLDMSEYRSFRNKIYWISEYLFNCSFKDYFEGLKPGEDYKLTRDNLVFRFPVMSISSEICKIISEDYIYTPKLSILARQLIEHYCLTRECDALNILEQDIVAAALSSHNKHVGGEEINPFGKLNMGNPGLFKVLSYNVKFTKLAKKYNYEFMYNLFSGDAHHTSTINKFIPNLSKANAKYYQAYLYSLFSVLCEMLDFYKMRFMNETSFRLDDAYRIQVKD